MQRIYTIGAFLLFARAAIAVPFDSEYRIATHFVGSLGLELERISCSTNDWNAPPFFICAPGETNFVTLANSRETERGKLVFVDCVSTNHSGNAMICVCSNRVAALEELCFPVVAFSSMPVEMKVAKFNASVSNLGVVEIADLTAPDNKAMFSFGNVAIRYEGTNARLHAVALLRAGGVDIPEDSSPPEPDTE